MVCMTQALAAALHDFRNQSIAAERAKQDLDRAIADAARAGVPQVEIVRVTGYTRERVRQICQPLSGPTPEEWWADLNEGDRAAFLANRGQPLTKHILNKALDANIKVAGAKWSWDPSAEYDFRLPPEFREFLDTVHWWEQLDDTDRAAFLAARSGPLSEDLYEKATAAGVKIWRWSFDETAGEPGRLPAAFRAFLDARARD
jgi:hypothetical protein